MSVDNMASAVNDGIQPLVTPAVGLTQGTELAVDILSKFKHLNTRFPFPSHNPRLDTLSGSVTQLDYSFNSPF